MSASEAPARSAADASSCAASPVLAAEDRPARALALREAAARANRALPVVACRGDNGDEARYAEHLASYAKGLPHDELGRVNPLAYRVYAGALATGRTADFEAIPLGGHVRLSNPLAAYAFSLEGADSCQIETPPPPPFHSAETAGELAELCWMALCRDVPFADYPNSVLVGEACADLAEGFSDFRGPRDLEKKIAPHTLFRERTAGALTGPYLSQFLWMDVPYGPSRIVQRYAVPAPGVEYLTGYDEWLRIQRGYLPDEALRFDDPQPRYLRSGRELAEYVHRDFSYQAFLNAALILTGGSYARHELKAPFARANPYLDSLTQTGFGTFGAPHVLDLIPRAASLALKACWFQKWLVSRRLRPEEAAGLLHNHLLGKADAPLHRAILEGLAPRRLREIHGSFLLPQAYPEGCPAHPAYPAGHAAIAGACATVLKAFFEESFVLPTPVEPTPDGLALHPCSGKAALTVGGEIDKLAANVALGRALAGVHWRSDCTEGLRMGERVALSLLRDWQGAAAEPPGPARLTGFDGQTLAL